MYYRVTAETGLKEQRQWAHRIESQFGPDCKLVSIGVPEILVLLQKTNPNRYVIIISGLGDHIDAHTPGGFDGWLAELESYDPRVIVLGPTSSRFNEKIMSWLQERYQRMEVGDWELFVKDDHES